ncbi:MAG: hypothetical protein WD049_04700 [Candidatus Paceibacterota bacterium]
MPTKQVKKTNIFRNRLIEIIREMIEIAAEGNCTVMQKLNGVTVLVNGDSDAGLIFRDQQRSMLGYIEDYIGPYPNPDLTGWERESDARKKAEYMREWEKKLALREEKVRLRREAVDAKLANAPEMELVDEEWWRMLRDRNLADTNVPECAERWARLIQLEMAQNGRELEDVADDTFHEANIDDFNGIMYGRVVSTLARYWAYGEQLRCWNNKRFQVGDEGDTANILGGVLYPALLSI